MAHRHLEHEPVNFTTMETQREEQNAECLRLDREHLAVADDTELPLSNLNISKVENKALTGLAGTCSAPGSRRGNLKKKHGFAVILQAEIARAFLGRAK